MARKLTILLAMLAVFGQALAGAAYSRAGAGEIAHFLAHVQEDAHHHHHHDDSAMHVEYAAESAFHVHLDGANFMGLPPDPACQAAPALPHGPADRVAAAWTSPALDGLLRPPKTLS